MVHTILTSPLIGWLLQGPSRTLIEFTKARLIRLRFHGLQVLAEDAAILGDERHPQYPTVARYCTVLHCTVLYTVLYCTVPHRRQEVLLLGQGHLHRRPVPLPRTRQRLSGECRYYC